MDFEILLRRFRNLESSSDFECLYIRQFQIFRAYIFTVCNNFENDKMPNNQWVMNSGILDKIPQSYSSFVFIRIFAFTFGLHLSPSLFRHLSLSFRRFTSSTLSRKGGYINPKALRPITHSMCSFTYTISGSGNPNSNSTLTILIN